MYSRASRLHPDHNKTSALELRECAYFPPRVERGVIEGNKTKSKASILQLDAWWSPKNIPLASLVFTASIVKESG
jgi:hypothetical protein